MKGYTLGQNVTKLGQADVELTRSCFESRTAKTRADNYNLELCNVLYSVVHGVHSSCVGELKVHGQLFLNFVVRSRSASILTIVGVSMLEGKSGRLGDRVRWKW